MGSKRNGEGEERERYSEAGTIGGFGGWVSERYAGTRSGWTKEGEGVDLKWTDYS